MSKCLIFKIYLLQVHTGYYSFEGSCKQILWRQVQQSTPGQSLSSRKCGGIQMRHTGYHMDSLVEIKKMKVNEKSSPLFSSNVIKH